MRQIKQKGNRIILDQILFVSMKFNYTILRTMLFKKYLRQFYYALTFQYKIVFPQIETKKIKKWFETFINLDIIVLTIITKSSLEFAYRKLN